MVAGVLAATMSTLDSTINALCATLYNDILPKVNDAPTSQHLRNTSIISLALLVVALVASGSEGMLMLGLKIQSWTGGSLVGHLRRDSTVEKIHLAATHDWIGLVCLHLGTIGVALNVLYLDWNWNLNVYLGFTCSLLALWLWSKIHPNVQQNE